MSGNPIEIPRGILENDVKIFASAPRKTPKLTAKIIVKRGLAKALEEFS